MSSIARTIQKRRLRARGYTRQTKVIEISPTTGQPVVINLKKGQGLIIGPDGHSTKKHQYPRHA